MTDLHGRLQKIAQSYSTSLRALSHFVGETQSSIVTVDERYESARKWLRSSINSAAGPVTLPHGEVLSAADLESVMEGLESRAEVALTFPDLLLRMVFIYRVALFDAFLTDLLQAIMACQPNMLKDGKKTLTHREVIELSESGSLLDHLAQKELHEFSYASVREQSEWVKKKFNFPLVPVPSELAKLEEVMARRNLLVHSNGVVNRVYLSVVRESPYSVGDQLSVDDAYWNDADGVLYAISGLILKLLSEKFCGQEVTISLKAIYKSLPGNKAEPVS